MLAIRSFMFAIGEKNIVTDISMNNGATMGATRFLCLG